MFTMAVGQGDDVDPSDAIATAIDQCRATLGGHAPQAGILFSAFDSFDPSILAAVAAAFPTATVMGTTSAAEISRSTATTRTRSSLAMFASDTVDITAGHGHRPRHRRRCGVPLGGRPGDGRDTARAEGLRRADRGIRRTTRNAPSMRWPGPCPRA